MIILFVGPQGSGKGTQSKLIAEKLRIPHISSGDLLRAVEGPLKLEIETYTSHGRLVPNRIMLKIIRERISKPDCEKGFILDGFPRNLEQARALDSIVKFDEVVEISISDQEAIGRIANRFSCKRCGSVYNIKTSPPRSPGICDKDGEPIYQRDDDKEDAIKKRLKIYHKETEPILKHYPSARVNGEQGIGKVTKDILRALGQKQNI